LRIGVDVINEDGEPNLTATFNHVSQQHGTTTGEDTLAALHVDATLTKEIVELIQELLGMRTDQQLNLTGKDGRLTPDSLIDVAVLQQAIVLGVALTRDFVIESDDALFEALHDLQIRFTTTQLQDIHGKSANIDDIGHGVILQIAITSHSSSQRLRIADNLIDPDREAAVIEFKVYNLPLPEEVVLEPAMELSVVGRGETYQEGDVDGIQTFRNTSTLQLIGDCEEGQYIKTVIFSLVPHVRDALFRESVVLTLSEDVIALYSKLVVRNNDSGCEQGSWGLNAAVAVIDRNNHMTKVLLFFIYQVLRTT